MNAEQRANLLKQPKLDLGGRHKRKRLALIVQCGATQDREAVAPLSTVLSDPTTDMEVRILAAKALGDIGDSQGVQALSDMLKTLENQELSHTAVLALGQIGDIVAARALIGKWESGAILTRQWIEETLRSLTSEVRTRAFAEALTHAAPRVRTWAKENLSLPELIPVLVPMLQTGSPKSIPELQSVLAQFGTASVPPLVSALAAAEGDHCQAILTTLQEIGEPAIPTLIHALDSADPDAQATILSALQSIGEPAISPLISALADAQGETQTIILNALQSFGELAVRPLLSIAPDYSAVAEMLLTGMQEVTAKALETPTTADIPLLINALNFADETLLRIIQQALVAIGEPAVSHLIDRLGDDRLSSLASDGLVKIGKPAVKSLLMALDTCPQSRTVLLRMEQDIEYAWGRKEVEADEIAWLIELLQTVDAELQPLVSRALRRIGGPAVPELLQLLADNDEQQQQVAQAALKNALHYEIYGSTPSEIIALLLQKIHDQKSGAEEKLVETMCSALKERTRGRGVDKLASLTLSAHSDYLELAVHLYFRQALWPYNSVYVTAIWLDQTSISYEEQSCFEDVLEEYKQTQHLGYSPRSSRGGVMLEPREATQAICQLQSIATIAPEFALPHYWLGQWYYWKLKDIEKAIQAFERATQCQEYIYENRKAKSYWWLGVCYGASSPHFDYDKSLNCFHQAIELGWDHRLVHQAKCVVADRMADLCLETGENPGLFLHVKRQSLEAVRAFVERSDQEDTDNWEQLLHSLKQEIDHLEELYAKFGEISGFMKVRREFLARHALKMLQDGQMNEAIALLHQVLQQNPDDLNDIPPELRSMMIAHMQREYPELVGQPDEIMTMLIQADEASLAAGYGDLGSMYAQQGDNLRAIEAYQKANELFVKLGDAHGMALVWDDLGNVYRQLGDISNAIAYCHKALDILERIGDQHSMAGIHFSLGRLYYHDLGELAQARIHFEKAVDINPTDDAAWLFLGIIHHQQGDIENAMTCIIQAAKLGNRDAIGMLR